VILSPWLGVTNFADLQSVMMRFLDGEVRSTPFHLGPLDSESALILDELKALTTKGFVTFNSQPGMRGRTFDDKKDYAQRAFVLGVGDYLTMSRLVTMANTVGLIVGVSTLRKGTKKFDRGLVTLGGHREDSGVMTEVAGRSPSVLDELKSSMVIPRSFKKQLGELYSVTVVDTMWSTNRMWGFIIDALDGAYDDKLDGLGVFK
jgi:hypothetical protein